jgi:hypothetical protein
VARKVYTAKQLIRALIVWAIAGPLIVWFIVSIVESPSNPHSSETASATSSATTTNAAPPTAAVIPNEPKTIDEATWQYHQETDSFSNQKFQYATVKSKSTLEFGFPYQGEQHATLLYQPNADKDGTVSQSFTLSIERGQFICADSEFCRVLVKYDDGKMETWSGSKPSDGSTNYLRFTLYDECFPVRFAGTKSLSIKAEFYQEGTQIIEFNVSGLRDLPLPKPSEKQLRKCHAPENVARS